MLSNNAQYMEMVLSLANKYKYNQQHSMTVERLSVNLFEQLSELHILGESELTLLRHSALLHDIGMYISLKKHHINSAYIVYQDEELDEYPVKEREMLAVLVRNHRKGVKLSESDFSRKEYKTLSQLVAILRIADVLDYYHQGNAVIEKVILKNHKCIIKVSGISLDEIKEQLAKKSAFFKKAFGLKAVILADEEDSLLSEDNSETDEVPENETIEDNFIIESEDDDEEDIVTETEDEVDESDIISNLKKEI